MPFINLLHTDMQMQKEKKTIQLIINIKLLKIILIGKNETIGRNDE